ncbi:amidase domain-containing protein [Paenibacillus bouchesdurhonensis]|uniref:amidase domain-containing protein n=1 Tax=Paenibacillus bouchesdurhonensis TaxID=1870990 RepID=UPI000DA61F0A|nr:amidase domain-containing protein [Paenibacillus bouchesdurhonensis]
MKLTNKMATAVILLCLVLLTYRPEITAASDDKQENEVRLFLNKLYKQRADALINRNMKQLESYYVNGFKVSMHAYRNEENRTNYLNEWASKRAIKLVKADSDIRIVRLKLSNDTAKISLVQSLKVDYSYLNKYVPVQSFGIGTEHFITLKKVDNDWKVYKEWYLDPLDENPNKIAATEDGLSPSVKYEQKLVDGKRYRRARAVEYANKYAGTAWGAGNNHRYNRKYADYSGRGGDCTNFASQVVGDEEEGGGLPKTGGWRYFSKKGGSEAWIRTDSFYNFLVYSGYGKLLARGNFRDIVAPSAKYPNGALSQIHPGDLIGYIISGSDVDHFSVVVGFDDYGYPLVNSHSADRYRVPFDLGWDQHTKYLLVHIKDH